MLRLQLLRAVLIAGDVRIDGRNLEPADRRDRARRRLGRGSHAGEAACLLLGEDDAANVCRLALEARGVDVDDRELRVRVLRRDAGDRVAHQEPDGDHEVVALLGGRREIRDVVGGALRDQRAALDPVLRLRLLEALVGERVEPLVVEAADVRDQRHLDRGRLGLGRRRRGRRRGGAAAGGHDGESDCEEGDARRSRARNHRSCFPGLRSFNLARFAAGTPAAFVPADDGGSALVGHCRATVEPFLHGRPQVLRERRVALLDLPEIALEQRDQPHRRDGDDGRGAAAR